MNPRTIFLYLSLRCGCPVDTSVKQKHRPSRQTRCVNGCGNPPFHLSSLRAPQGARQSVFPLRVLRILSCFALRMTSHFVIAKVRVSGGDLCEAEAPTEPAGGMYKRLRQSAFPSLVIASAARCAAIRFPPLRVLRILSCFALRMTSRLVIETPVNGRRFYIFRRPQGFWLLPFTPSGHRFFVFFIFFAFGFTVFVF